MRARVVFPTPGGPHKIKENKCFSSMAILKGIPSPTRCCWPTKSSSESGRILEARGSILTVYQNGGKYGKLELLPYFNTLCYLINKRIKIKSALFLFTASFLLFVKIPALYRTRTKGQHRRFAI